MVLQDGASLCTVLQLLLATALPPGPPHMNILKELMHTINLALLYPRLLARIYIHYPNYFMYSTLDFLLEFTSSTGVLVVSSLDIHMNTPLCYALSPMCYYSVDCTV